MRKKIITGVAVVLVALYLVRSTHGQVQSVPGPGSGIVAVQGEVDVRRLPPIDVGQRGDWTVAAAPLAFLKVGGRYDVTWPAGDRETIGVAQLGSGGWVRAAAGGRPRWLNLSVAKAIEETH